MGNYTAVCDCDAIKWAAAAAGEKRTIIAVHKQHGSEKPFANRTEFWGRGKQIGGWLGEQNAKRTSPFEKEDFDIIDVQEAEPVNYSLATAKSMHKNWLQALGTTKHKSFVGSGTSFRLERSTLLGYKQNRVDTIKPKNLDDVFEYISKYIAHEVVTGIEVDDRVTMEAWKKPDHVVAGMEKDFYSCPINYMNMSRVDEGVINCDQFGKLYLDAKGNVKGYGRIHLYFQCLSQDSVDNYKANCFSDIAWGAKSAFKALEFCENDKQALQVVVDSYKLLYPEPKIITGWRGDEFEINWLYVLSEIFDLARMLRFPNDNLKVTDVLNKVGISYE